MSSTPRSDDTQTSPPAPVMFQAPRPGPGRPPSSTSTSEPPQSTTPETSPSSPAESSTSQEPDWSIRNRLGDDEPTPASATSGASLGSEVGAEALSGLRGSIAAGIVNATEAAHNILTDDVGRHLDQFRATETEIMEISDAGARIISRKLPAGVGNKDFEDFLRVGMAVVSYVGRQVKILNQARTARRQLRAATAARPTADQAA
jgi:hypothetical protein